MISKTLFTTVIGNLQAQFDKDRERANVLSEIYGSDIDPVDNSRLTESIFQLLKTRFNKEAMEDIKIFCYEQNFGRQTKTSIEDLWESILKNIDVTL